MSKIKIFVTYKDKHKVLKSDIITPIQTGRAIAKEIFEEMIGDDTGDNISKDNPKYNELSGQYWVWKNYDKIDNPEYVGFMHYRRHFIFDKNFKIENRSSWFNGMNIYNVDFLEECLNNIKDENILNTISENADCYAIKKYNVQNMQECDLYMKEHYLLTIGGSKRNIWNAFYDTVSSRYPEYRHLLNNFTYGSHLNCCNMFIMKKELFFKYSEFCFNILKEIDRKIDSSKFNPQEMRFLGYIGEYVLTLFIMKLEEEGKYIKYLNAILIKNVDGVEKKPLERFLSKIFSIKNYGNKKIFQILGLKIKVRRNTSDVILNSIMIKLCELQQEIILNKKFENLERQIGILQNNIENIHAEIEEIKKQNIRI